MTTVLDLAGYGAVEATGATTIDPGDAVLATQLVERTCGLGAPLLPAILGLDEVTVPVPR